ncbi:MAG: hypothetical protein ALECFALPRED_007918 [Alectoria fallacina]|uniref:Uncharacterized protein n=1 Tax=Alectoria fallacina TaxID=1903189 RepID=A0A8H3J1C1_9LECA|nr:MAG: hypothetical protein ALECFALPRED_007918 [Alectoria fallacina]
MTHAKNFAPRADRVESGPSKAEQKRAHRKDKGDTAAEYGKIGMEHITTPMGARVKPTPKKPRVRVLETHSERVESLHQQYEVNKGEERKKKTEYSGLGAKAKRVRRKRGFQESKLSWPDDSEACRAVVEGSRKNVPCTGGQMGVEVTSSRPKKARARDSDSRFRGGKAYSKSPFMGAQGPGAGHFARTNRVLGKRK